MRRACVALLSDFGTRDVYAGVMKAVVARVAPDASLIDLTHEIPPGDVRQGAFRLWQALASMPEGTIFLAIVDPGVGTARRPLAIQCRGFSCVGPDNGIFTYVLQDQKEVRAVTISRPAHGASDTFHGRDIFAPAAGLLAAGTKIEGLGPEAADLVRIPWPRLSCDPAGPSVSGEALLADRFGNIVTSIGRLTRTDNSLFLRPWVPDCATLSLPLRGLVVRLPAGRALPLERTFGAGAPGTALAYVGSDNLLEIAVNRGSALDSLGLSPGADISLLSR